MKSEVDKSFSLGCARGKIALLFESPGYEECVYNAPLSGTTGLRYCQIVRELKRRGLKNGLSWEDFCINNAMVINACPIHARSQERLKIAMKDDRLQIISHLLSDGEKAVLLCFGKIACTVFDKLKERTDVRVTSVLKLWHISPANRHLSNCKKHTRRNPLWRDEIPLIGRYICKYAGSKGVFGWNEIIVDGQWEWTNRGLPDNPPQWLYGTKA